MGHTGLVAEPSRVDRDGLLLAIDIGTTTVRAMLFDLAGRRVGEARYEPPVLTPGPYMAEVEPELRYDLTLRAVRDCLQSAAVRPEQVLALSLSGLQHALVPLDGQGRVLDNAMLWMDQRCAPQAAWMSEEHGALLEELFGRAHMSTTMSAPKLRWLVEHRPELVAATRWFLPIKDYVRWRLTGQVATDPGDAGGTGMFNGRSGDWSQPILDLVGVARDKLPPIVPAETVAGGLLPEPAAAMGLLAGTPVVVGAGDVPATRLGAGTTQNNLTCMYIGTASWIAPPQRRKGRFGSTATTGAALKWVVDLLSGRGDEGARSDDYARNLEAAAEVPIGACGLVFLPHLMGERGPVSDPLAKGTLFGLTLAHRQPQVVRAVLEGCALHLRSIYDQLTDERLPEVVAVGGGVKSPIWRQIIADATGVALIIPEEIEAGALGVAILAGVGAGVYGSLAEGVAQTVRYVDRAEPDRLAYEQYGRIYEVYAELEERVSPLYARVPVSQGDGSCVW
jgi:xylulokinase